MARKSSSELILILDLDMFISFHVAVEEHVSQGSVVHRLPLQVQLCSCPRQQLTSAQQVLCHYVRLWVDTKE